MKYYSVVLDTLGSDKGPAMAAKGAAMALEKYPDLKIVLSGDEEFLRAEMTSYGVDPERVAYINAPD
ncbi:MAG: hypothetical protein J6Q69_06695, partial [Clostridia bacterium]|nr:hypothetical protein [Clostridia bacterium]